MGNGVIAGNLNLGTGQLAKTDAGTWTVNTNATHGNLVIGNGTLVVNTTNALTPTSPLNFNENTNNRLTINSGFSQAFASIINNSGSNGAHTIDGAGSLNVGASGMTLTVNNGTAANDITLTANVIGAGTLTKAGAGHLVMNNTVAGPVALTNGTMSSNSTVGGLITMLAQHCFLERLLP